MSPTYADLHVGPSHKAYIHFEKQLKFETFSGLKPGFEKYPKQTINFASLNQVLLTASLL
jgi:hypothetical protein